MNAPQITVRMSLDQKRKLEAISEKTGIAVAILVRNWILGKINEFETKGFITIGNNQ